MPSFSSSREHFSDAREHFSDDTLSRLLFLLIQPLKRNEHHANNT